MAFFLEDSAQRSFYCGPGLLNFGFHREISFLDLYLLRPRKPDEKLWWPLYFSCRCHLAVLFNVLFLLWCMCVPRVQATERKQCNPKKSGWGIMIRFIIRLYIVLLIADVVLSFFPQTLKFSWRIKLKKICDYTCEPIRRILPNHLPFDFSPMIVIFLCSIFIELFYYLW